MSNFIKDAIAELEHVVWPTPTETRKYMTYTVGVIVILGAFLAILGYILRDGLSALRDQSPHMTATTVSGENGNSTATQEDLSGVLEKIAKQHHATGATDSTPIIVPGTLHTGSVLPTIGSVTIGTGTQK